MKNKIIYTAALSLLCMGFTSCGDSWLDTESKTTHNSANFNKSEQQIDASVIGCYDGYQRTVSNGNFPPLFLVTEMGGDDALGGGGPDDRTCRVIDRLDQNLNSSDVSFLGNLWSDYYKGIERCNDLLAKIDGVTFTNEDDKKAAIGETRAIRGLEYFDLVRTFENVPLLTTVTSDVVPQSDPDAVYAQIVADLKYAADNIPADYYTTKSSSLGRITRYAAGSMLARVYLFYDGVYNNNQRGTMPGDLTAAQALKYCEEVIASGQYKLEPNFQDLWPAAATTASSKADGWINTYKEASDELVWVVKFNNDQDWTSSNIDGNRFVVNLGIGIWDGSSAPYGPGWQQAPISAKAYNLFEDGDKRRDASIINFRKEGFYDKEVATTAYDMTGYSNKKYCPLIYTDGTSIPAYTAMNETSGANFMTSQDQDWVLMRYSDVLLMAAELGSPNAMRYYNLVVERAFGNTSHDLTTTPTTQQIWDERRLEFMGEALRYWDLRRQGLDAFVKGIMAQGQTVYNNGKETDITDSYQEANIRSKRGFWQIPNNQITLSGNVYKQNAGW